MRQIPFEVSAIILAGGSSKRMGREKGLIELGDRRLIEYPVATARALCSEILIITNNQESFEFLGLPCIPDIKPDLGPLMGLLTGLTNASNDVSLLISYDMPFVTEEAAWFLISQANQASAVVPQIGGRLQPLFAVYRRNCLSLIKDTIDSGELAVTDFLAHLNVRIITEDEFAAAGIHTDNISFSINSPQDLAEAEALLDIMRDSHE